MSRQTRRAWPRLAKLDIKRLSKRPETPDIVRKLLEPKELVLLDVSSAGSEISDVFEEFHKHSFYNTKKSGKKNMSKYEADVLTMAEFTDGFKYTMEMTRKLLQVSLICNSFMH